MANIRSALKRIRQTSARTERNKAIKSRLKTARKAVDTALAQGNLAEAEKRARIAASYAGKAAKSHIIHKSAARRIQSQLASKLAAKKQG
jgi:small subunit ribosomal protein S20